MFQQAYVQGCYVASASEAILGGHSYVNPEAMSVASTSMYLRHEHRQGSRATQSQSTPRGLGTLRPKLSPRMYLQTDRFEPNSTDFQPESQTGMCVQSTYGTHTLGADVGTVCSTSRREISYGYLPRR